MNHSPTTGTDDRRQGPHLTEGVCRGLLNALLSPAEREAALAHIAVCPACERLFKETVVERENLRSAIALRSGPNGEVIIERRHEPIGREPAADDRIVQAEIPGAQTKIQTAATHRVRGPLSRTLAGMWVSLRAGLRQPRYGFRFGLGLVAIAAILLVLLWPHRQQEADARLRWLPISSEGSSVRAVAGAVANRDLAAGFEAYAARDLDRAIELLRSAEAFGQSETARRVFLASALAWSGKHAEAVSVLKTVRARTLPDPWGSEARWTLYLALMESGHEMAADSLLGVLARERGEVGDRARRLLQP